MDTETVLANIAVYVMVLSALALGVERLMDLIKSFSRNKLVREPRVKGLKADVREEYEKKEEARQRYIRVWAIPVGILLAILAQVDTFDLLGLPSPFWFGYPVLGVVLSGMAASRGSAFWHDIIDLIRTVKETRAQVAAAKAGE